MYNEMQYKTETKTAVSNAINVYMPNTRWFKYDRD